VEGYIERIEKQSESQAQVPNNNPVVQDDSTKTSPIPDMGQLVASQMAQKTGGKIMLPLAKDELDVALHQKIGEGVRWLGEWCLMMIKKYPGRVFYLAKDHA
jgi:hypothetical protein